MEHTIPSPPSRSPHPIGKALFSSRRKALVAGRCIQSIRSNNHVSDIYPETPKLAPIDAESSIKRITFSSCSQHCKQIEWVSIPVETLSAGHPTARQTSTIIQITSTDGLKACGQPNSIHNPSSASCHTQGCEADGISRDDDIKGVRHESQGVLE